MAENKQCYVGTEGGTNEFFFFLFPFFFFFPGSGVGGHAHFPSKILKPLRMVGEPTPHCSHVIDCNRLRGLVKETCVLAVTPLLPLHQKQGYCSPPGWNYNTHTCIWLQTTGNSGSLWPMVFKIIPCAYTCSCCSHGSGIPCILR